MYRLLIVDDEPIIADGLQEVLREEFRDALDVCKAYAAEEAIEWLDRTRVDILLSDICMPRMDGLALLEQVHARWPACRVIFLTGHGSFDSVYTAIQYPNVSYLLKMEGYDKVIQTVREVAAELDRTFAREALLRDAQTRSLRARELMREQYLDGVLNGRFHQHEINRDQLGELQIPLRPDWPVLLLLGRVENMRRDLPWSEKNRKMYGIRQLADRCFGTRMRYIEWADATDHLVWLLQPPSSDVLDETADAPSFKQSDMRESLPDKEDWQAVRVGARGQAEVIQRGCMEAYGIAVSFSLDAEPAGWLALPERLPALKAALSYRIGGEKHLLVAEIEGTHTGMGKNESEFEGVRAASTMTSHAVTDVSRLAEWLEYGQQEEFYTELEALTSGWLKVRGQHDLCVCEQYLRIALMLLSYVNRWGCVGKVAFQIGIHKLLQADAHRTWEKAIAYLRQFAGILFEIQEQEREHRVQDVIGQILRHIADHLTDQDELTLVRLAEVARLNPSYLSRLFKQVTGMNLSEHIGEARIRFAKELLGNADLRINQVAETLGYGTATNFTRFFRKVAGMTPQEYREHVQRMSTDESDVNR